MTRKVFKRINLFSILISSNVIFSFIACAPLERLSVEQEVLKEETLKELLSKSVLAFRENTSAGNSKASALLGLAYELSPRDVRVLDGLGCVAWRNNDFELAEHYFKKAIKLDPKYDRGYMHLSLVAENKSDLVAAKELLQIALQLNPLNYRARNNYAVLLQSLSGTDTDSRDYSQQWLKAYYGASSVDEVLLYNKKLLSPRFETEQSLAASKK